MGDRIFTIVLKCGCMMTEEGDENPGLMPCYAEYGDIDREEDRKALDLHNKCWEEYHKAKMERELGIRRLTDEELNEVMEELE